MLVSMNRVELHFHALPGVDDGPATIDASLDLLSVAATEDTGTVVATPHVRPDFLTDVSDLAERVRELQSAVDAARLPVSVRRGGELGHEMVGRLSQDELETIAQGPPHARWLLIEAAFELIAEGLLRAVSSDAHGPTRPPLLGEARAQLIQGGIPPAVYNSLIGGCPRRLLARGVPSAAMRVA